MESEQLEQAVAMLANAVAWSRPPASDTVSPLQQMQNAQNALAVVVQEARRAQRLVEPQVEPDPVETVAAAAPVMADVSSNGEG